MHIFFAHPGCTTLSNSNWRESLLTQMPAYTSCCKGTFLFAFQLVQALTLWQSEPFQDHVGLWLQHHPGALSVSNQPVDAYCPRPGTPWGRNSGLSDKEGRCRVPASFPWRERSLSWTWSEWLQRQHRQSARLSARVPLASQVQWFLKVFKGWTPGVSSLSLLSGAPLYRVSDTRVFWHLSLLLNISGHGPVKNQQWLKQKPCLQSEAFQFSRWGLGEGTEVTADPWRGTVDINSPYSKVVMLVGTWPSRSLQELHPNAWSHGLDCCFQNQCSCEVSGQSSAMQGTKASLMRALPCICQASPSHCIL